MKATTLGRRNLELMEPIAALMRASDADVPTKVAVLVDLAGAILATHAPARMPSELRLISEEMRKRLIQATRLHQQDLDARQEKARTAPASAPSTSYEEPRP